MKLLYRGFDKLEIAFKCQIGTEFMVALETAQVEARENHRPSLLEFAGVRMMVGEAGSRGGYAFVVDSGPEGGNWAFKRPNPKDLWGARVSVKALPLMLYGMENTRSMVYAFMHSIGCKLIPGGESIARIDYAMDFLIPGFELEPEHFVMHSNTNRRDHVQELSTNGRSGVVTSVTVGKMPGRQVIVYDKRREILASGKHYMLPVWNAQLKHDGLKELDLSDRSMSQIWRVEARLGKDEFKKRWNASTWSDVDQILGDMFRYLLEQVRYVKPSKDANRSRWPNHELWDEVTRIVMSDLHEMSCRATPSEVRNVIREEHAEMMRKQMQGLSITYAVTMGYGVSDVDEFPELIESTLENAVRRERKHLEKKFETTEKRLAFISPCQHQQQFK